MRWNKPEGSRRRGINRLRWLEDVEKDLREMKVKSWRQKPVGREKLVSVIRGSRAVQPRSKEIR